MRGAVALVLAIALALPSVARAADVSPQARARARAYIKRARAFYDQEQYDQAVAEYESAYKIVGVSDILFNIGQILKTKGDKPAAVKAYRRYLQVEPTGAHAEEARDFAQELTRDQVPPTARSKWDFVEHQQRSASQEKRWLALNERVGAGDLDGIDAELDALQNEINRPNPVVIDDAATRRAVVATVTEKPREPSRPLPPYAKKWWFWTALGGGAVVVIAIVVGAVLGQPKDPMPSLGVLR